MRARFFDHTLRQQLVDLHLRKVMILLQRWVVAVPTVDDSDWHWTLTSSSWTEPVKKAHPTTEPFARWINGLRERTPWTAVHMQGIHAFNV